MKYTIEIPDGVIPGGFEPVAYRPKNRGETYDKAGSAAVALFDGTSHASLILKRKTPEFKVGDWVRITQADNLSYPDVYQVTSVGEMIVVDTRTNIGNFSYRPSSLKHCDPPKPTPPKWLKKGWWLTQDKGGECEVRGVKPRIDCGRWVYTGAYDCYFNFDPDDDRYHDIPPEFEYLTPELCIVEGVAE